MNNSPSWWDSRDRKGSFPDPFARQNPPPDSVGVLVSELPTARKDHAAVCSTHETKKRTSFGS